MVVEFSSSYCKYCLKLNAIIDKISKDFIETPQYKIHFSRINLENNDNYLRKINEIPLLVLYKSLDQSYEIDISDLSESKISINIKAKIILI